MAPTEVLVRRPPVPEARAARRTYPEEFARGIAREAKISTRVYEPGKT